jgi:hypothetical protein
VCLHPGQQRFGGGLLGGALRRGAAFGGAAVLEAGLDGEDRRVVGRYPHNSANKQHAARQWLEHYTAQSQPFATCTFLEALGSGRVDRQLTDIIRRHDDSTKAESGLPLA